MSVVSVTVAIATYARVKWLEEAVYSALAQECYTNEVLVLNDCPRQTLRCNDLRVRVINTLSTFPTLGDKRNHLICEARGQWIVFLDDDDVILPWHSKRIRSALQAGKRTAAATHGFFFDGDKGSRVGASLMDIAVERELAISCGGFASLDNRDEHAFIDNLAKVEELFRVDTKDNPSYVYMWGNGVHHISGNGDPFGGKGFREHANRCMDTKIEPTGDIVVRPHYRRDYLKLAAQALHD